MPERFEVVQQDAGGGGFGRVHKARDLILERHVAIKALDPIFKLAPSEEDKARFRREARILASLSHPNIPAIYDVQFDEAAQDFRIIFEWIEGTHLSKHLQERGVLTLDQSRRWFSNLCSALQHAHSKGVIHRDVKPANIILASASDVCYLVDFGISLSKQESERLTGSTAVGSPGYMSPEQERGDDLTPASDLFTVAIVLYECLAGSRPALGGYHPLHTLNEAIPPAVDRLIQSCLREKPEERVQSAADFMTQLSRALEPHATFADTLTQGSLYEVQLALHAMSAVAFSQLPLGQRLTVMTRLKDLLRVNEDRLQNAVATLIADLVRVAHISRPADYALVVEHALQYGYERRYTDTWTGNNEIREALSEVSPHVHEGAHEVICEKLFQYLEGRDLSSKAKWYFHDLRVLLQSLLANFACKDVNAERLAERLDQINIISH
jgi:serine/threonine-protein kinase